MLTQALGLIETIGMAAAVEAADTAIKSSNVRLIGYELTNGEGMVTVKFEGDVGAVKAAIQAAKLSAEKVSGVFSTLIIPRPAKGIESFVCSIDTIGIELANEEETSTESTEKLVSSEAIDIGESEIDKTVSGESATDELTVSEDSAADEMTVSKDSVADEMAASGETATTSEAPSEESSTLSNELIVDSPTLEEPTVEESPLAEKSIETAEAPKPRRSRKKLPSS